MDKNIIKIPEYINNQIGRHGSLQKALELTHIENNGMPITLVEIGTTRGGKEKSRIFGDGRATVLWAWYADNYNSIIHTVDLKPEMIAICKEQTKENKNIKYHISDSIEFFKHFVDTIDFLYLDSHKDPNVMYNEFINAEKNFKVGTFILLDDVGKNFEGKGEKLVPFLLNNETYEKIYHDFRSGVNQILFKRVK